MEKRLTRTKDFVKMFQKLDEKIRVRFQERIELFMQDLYHPVLRHEFLKGEWKDHRSIRITGDVRAIFKEIGNGIFEFRAIGTHAQLFRKF